MTCSEAKGNAKFIPVKITKQTGSRYISHLLLNLGILLALRALQSEGQKSLPIEWKMYV